MTGRTLILRSLRFYWRTHLGVAAGAAVATAVLLGALLVGDSVRGSLKALALARLGDIQLAVTPSGRFFPEDLADELGDKLGVNCPCVLELRGTAARAGGNGYVPDVRVIGVDERFWQIGGGSFTFAGRGELIALNERLAGSLGAGEGDRIIISLERPGVISREAPLTTDQSDVVRRALTVAAVLGDADFGRFDLDANQAATLNAFVPLGWLQAAAGLDGRANVLLVGGAEGKPISAEHAASALRMCWDGAAELRKLPETGEAKVLELRSRRVFLDPATVEAALKADVTALGVLTYLANEIRSADASVPYSMVTALGVLRGPKRGEKLPDDPAWTIVPDDMADDEIIISSWLAENDLDRGPVRRIEMSYYVPTPGGQLEEVSRGPLAVRRVREMDDPPGSPAAILMEGLMPTLPTLPEKPTLKDLKLGTRIDKNLIRKHREKLDKYWSRYHGTPKAFVTLK
ncbi:MAG: hypothetical protein ACYTF6_14150, partial [Planctomycetota bacterium]